MNNNEAIKGFSKLSKADKLKTISTYFEDSEAFVKEFEGFYHSDEKLQSKFDEFSENTITNFYLPFSVAPNFKINDRVYAVPMVIEESSVVAAASNAAKFWFDKGGFKAEVVDTVKIGQVHFIWNGRKDLLQKEFSELKKELILNTKDITKNMENRGGGILDIELVDMNDKEPGYFQLKCSFETIDSMGANFVNSCLEEFASTLEFWIENNELFTPEEKKVDVIMSILSNYTPDCLVRVWVECPVEDLGVVNGMPAEEFAWKFEKAIKIAEVDPYRATTHNKGIYNGIDAVVLATGNDFRAVEACGHAYAARNGSYASLTSATVKDGQFKFQIEVPMALGVVGGLTTLHPVVKRGLELLGNPSAKELMKIVAATGLAQNFGAIKSLVTTGIQKGHMKMHLMNILNSFDATQSEKDQAIEYFKEVKVSVSSVRAFMEMVRKGDLETI